MKTKTDLNFHEGETMETVQFFLPIIITPPSISHLHDLRMTNRVMKNVKKQSEIFYNNQNEEMEAAW